MSLYIAFSLFPGRANISSTLEELMDHTQLCTFKERIGGGGDCEVLQVPLFALQSALF